MTRSIKGHNFHRLILAMADSFESSGAPNEAKTMRDLHTWLTEPAQEEERARRWAAVSTAVTAAMAVDSDFRTTTLKAVEGIQLSALSSREAATQH